MEHVDDEFSKSVDMSLTLCHEILRLLAASGASNAVIHSAMNAALAHLDVVCKFATLREDL
jgi:hypothetical protein